MSTRLLLNLALGIVTLLLLVSVGVVVTSLGDREKQVLQADLALQQQALVQDLNQDVSHLAAADNLLGVNQARSRLGETVVRFDQTMAALVKGGPVDNPDGTVTSVPAVKGGQASEALNEAARIWVETGLPLADLAAAEFSVFSAAGQQAVADLAANSPELANQLGIVATSLQVHNNSQHARAGYARFAVVVFGLALGALGFARFKPARKNVPTEQTVTPRSAAVAAGEALAGPTPEPTPISADSPVSAPVQTLEWTRHSGNSFNSPVDFDNVSASVDQMSVDMNTIAGSTDKMRLAIDSVGHALQGMLYSLNEMAQDTAEGYKIVRGANNAASYTASTAGELATSAREMSRVVARVTQLAHKTKQVAAQIDAEAVATGTPGEKFTSVVAAEVKGLSRQTSVATQEIEDTVAEILGTARQYEEAIGQIIKNISAINKVSEKLGDLMLHPPTAGVAGTPLPGATARPLDPQAAPEASPTVTAPDFEDDLSDEPTVDEVVEETSSAIEDAADEMIGSEASIGEEEAPAEEEPEPGSSNGNDFLLGGDSSQPESSPDALESANAETPVAEPRAEENVPVPEPDAPAPQDTTAQEPEPAPEPDPFDPEAVSEQPADEEAGGTNIFMLKKPKESRAEKQAVEEEAVTVPPDDDEPKSDGGSSNNIFMLNKPKK